MKGLFGRAAAERMGMSREEFYRFIAVELFHNLGYNDALHVCDTLIKGKPEGMRERWTKIKKLIEQTDVKNQTNEKNIPPNLYCRNSTLRAGK